MKLPCQENPTAENDRALLAWKLCTRIRATLDRYHAQDLRNCLRRHDLCSSGTVQGYDFARTVAGALRGCLSENEICHLAEYFRSPDGGGVAYGLFLDVVAGEDEGVGGKELERTLSVSEHRRLSLVLMEIAQALRFREQVLRPYFEDYDLIAGNGGSVTLAYFKRVLYFLGITLRKPEFTLLAKRFMVGHYKIDYEAFIEEIDGLLRYLDGRGPIDRECDGEVPAKIIAVDLPKVVRPEVGTVDLAKVLQKDTAYHPCLAPSRQERDFRTLMLRIQRYVWENRVRIREFFEQYDTFQCGLISRSQFVRAMDAVGLSGLHRMPLTDGEVRSVCDRYGDARDVNRIRWDRFTDDVDEVFTVKNLDRGAFREVESPPEEVRGLEREGCREGRDLAKELVDCIRTLVAARRVLIEPVFKDFDPHRNGHISRSQVGEALSMAGVFITEEQRYALNERYSDDLGFNYVNFLKDFDPCPKIASAYEEMQDRLAKINADAGPEPHPHEQDIVRVLAKVKGQVVRRRLRIVDYMRGFDPLNHHRITCDQFRRGLATASIDLSPTEVRTLARIFQTPLHHDTVDYKRFCDTVAEVDYQCNLEKAPRLVPLRHFPSEDGPHNHLNFEERTIVSKALQRLARQADVVSNLSAPLRDFDRNHLGVVNRNQLIRAMATRGELHNAVSSREFELLCKCFGVEIGHRREVNYRALLAALDYLYANRENHPF
ncbi:uncharacterized protein LOC120422565 [Culex pipiens pallens]|uniref:uncharacterized protein LOC120422565 n=1 Tax=Culex pipiens pallens TaxID=42434 RepID=UPI0019536A5A|nr:uncharacterized protein LOC120422565 [Culex pipiens pallens]